MLCIEMEITNLSISTLIPNMASHKKQWRQIVRQNKHIPVAQQLKVSVKGTELTINNALYKKQVPVPTTREILKAPKDERRVALSYPVYQGSSVSKQGSTFTPYASNVQSYDNVRKAYRQLRMHSADATHISCTYLLPRENFATCQDLTMTANTKQGEPY